MEVGPLILHFRFSLTHVFFTVFEAASSKCQPKSQEPVPAASDAEVARFSGEAVEGCQLGAQYTVYYFVFDRITSNNVS